MQKILLFFNREMANATPTDMVAGSAGGTVMVIRSRDLSMSTAVSVPSATNWGRVAAKPIIPTKAMAPTKMSESL